MLQIIMPGYCVTGTVGHKILNGQRKIEMEGKQILDVRMAVEVCHTHCIPSLQNIICTEFVCVAGNKEI